MTVPDRIDITVEILSSQAGLRFPYTVKWYFYPDGSMQVIETYQEGGSIHDATRYAGYWYYPITGGIGTSYDIQWTITTGTIQPPSDQDGVWLQMNVLSQLYTTQPSGPGDDGSGGQEGLLTDQFVLRADIGAHGSGVSSDHVDLHVHVHYEYTVTAGE